MTTALVITAPQDPDIEYAQFTSEQQINFTDVKKVNAPLLLHAVGRRTHTLDRLNRATIALTMLAQARADYLSQCPRATKQLMKGK